MECTVSILTDLLASVGPSEERQVEVDGVPYTWFWVCQTVPGRKTVPVTHCVLRESDCLQQIDTQVALTGLTLPFLLCFSSNCAYSSWENRAP